MHPRSKPCKTYNCFQKFCIVSYALQNIYKCWWMTRTINILAASASNKKKKRCICIYIIYISYNCVYKRTYRMFPIPGRTNEAQQDGRSGLFHVVDKLFDRTGR